jgi:DNA-binding transcriptional LysR family regulator
VPLVPQLLQRHPGLSLELSFTDQIEDLVEAGTDIAVRRGQLPPSDMVARLLGHTRQVILASPEYLARLGRPLHPDELGRHVRLGWSYQRAIPHWPFLVDGQRVAVDIGEVVALKEGDELLELAVYA